MLMTCKPKVTSPALAQCSLQLYQQRTALAQQHWLSAHDETLTEWRIYGSKSHSRGRIHSRASRVSWQYHGQQTRSLSSMLVAEFHRKYRRVSENRQESQW